MNLKRMMLCEKKKKSKTQKAQTLQLHLFEAWNQMKLIYGNRSQKVVAQKGGYLTGNGQKSALQGDGNIQHLGRCVGFTSICICQN